MSFRWRRTLGLLLLMAAVFGWQNSTLAQETDSITEVDLELVIAADISFSISAGEQNVQRRGYGEAFLKPEVIAAITSGPLGKIAVTYVEWAGPETQFQVVPWTLIDGLDAAAGFAETLERAPIHRGGETSISMGLTYASNLFGHTPFKGLRKVIDISGDGPNNGGPAIAGPRRQLLSRQVTINGLPLVGDAGDSSVDIDVAAYYKDCVSGGPGSFVFPVSSWAEFGKSISRKLVMEIAGLVPRPPAYLHLAALQPETDCLAGEKAMRNKYLKQLDDLTNGKSKRWRPREQDWPTPK